MFCMKKGTVQEIYFFSPEHKVLSQVHSIRVNCRYGVDMLKLNTIGASSSLAFAAIEAARHSILACSTISRLMTRGVVSIATICPPKIILWAVAARPHSMLLLLSWCALELAHINPEKN